MAASKTLSQREMEYELDHCPVPWVCPAACYGACAGCAQKQVQVDEHMEMKADLVRKYGGDGE